MCEICHSTRTTTTTLAGMRRKAVKSLVLLGCLSGLALVIYPVIYSIKYMYYLLCKIYVCNVVVLLEGDLGGLGVDLMQHH